MTLSFTGSLPELYERFLVGPLFQPFAGRVLDRVGVSGDRFLDVACGTGIVSRLARQRLADSARIVGVDQSPQMLEVARTIAPDIDWRPGKGEALPLAPDERFDVVVCHQGLQFFSGKAAGAREMRRALADGGRLAVAVWRALDDNAFFAELDALAERQLGPVTDNRHGYGDPNALASLLRDAGFRNVDVERDALTVRFPDPGVLLRLNSMAVIGMSAAGKTMTDEQKAEAVSRLVDESAPVVERYMDRGELAFVLTSNVATARA